MFSSSLIQDRVRRSLAGSVPARGESALRQSMENVRASEGYARVALFDGRGRPRMVVPSILQLLPSPAFALQIQAGLRLGRPTAMAQQKPSADPDLDLSLWVPIGVRGGAGVPAEGVMLFQAEAIPFLHGITRPWPHSRPSAETLLVVQDGGDAVILGARRDASVRFRGVRINMAEIRSAGGAGGQGVEGVFNVPDYRGRRVVAAVR